MSLVTIIIPIYKSELSDSERISLEQCCRILGKYEISLVCPENLSIIQYTKFFEKYQVSYSCFYFKKKYFQGIEGYNELLLSIDFYSTFKEFTYILIYQLDAFVFKDELEYWCSKGYDYIGAPWFKRLWRFKYSKNIRAIGNGGFSLRNVQACINVLNHKGAFKPIRYIFSFHNSVLLKLKKMPLKRWKYLKVENSVNFFTNINMRTEDQFWSLDTQNSNVNFSVAPIDEGIKFAFEYNPSYLYQLNHNTLPFGCHAWNRYEPDFWLRFIK